MPWHIESDNPECRGYAVVKDDDGEVEGCHATRKEAEAQVAALYASEYKSGKMTEHNYFDGGVPSQTFRKNAIKKNENGSFSVHGVRIFRTGQFRDSKGKKHTIASEDLKAMVDNWNHLRKSNIFPDVPVRKDHSTSVEKVMGYFSNLYMEQDGETHFLTADFDSMAEEDVNKLAMGLYRNVSAEVGVYPTNDDEMYYPTVMGVAYVDIPAVEGLFQKSSDGVSWTSNGLEISENAGKTLSEWVASRPEITYYNRVNQQESTVTTENDPKNFTFRIGGQDTTDFGKVQAYIAQVEGENETLKAENEQYAKERIEAEKADRANFVKSLSEGDAPKITAAQVESLQMVVASMNDETFAAFKESYEKAPALRQFAEFGNGSNHDGAPGKNERDEQLAVYRARVDTLRRSGMPQDKIEKTESFRKLTELEKASA